MIHEEDSGVRDVLLASLKDMEETEYILACYELHFFMLLHLSPYTVYNLHFIFYPPIKFLRNSANETNGFQSICFKYLNSDNYIVMRIFSCLKSVLK